MRPPIGDHTPQAAFTLSHTAAVIAAAHHPAALPAACDESDVMRPDNDHAGCRASCIRSIARPPAREIARAIGNAERLPHPPAAPSRRARIAVGNHNVMMMIVAPDARLRIARSDGAQHHRHGDGSPWFHLNPPFCLDYLASLILPLTRARMSVRNWLMLNSARPPCSRTLVSMRVITASKSSLSMNLSRAQISTRRT